MGLLGFLEPEVPSSSFYSGGLMPGQSPVRTPAEEEEIRKAAERQNQIEDMAYRQMVAERLGAVAAERAGLPVTPPAPAQTGNVAPAQVTPTTPLKPGPAVPPAEMGRITGVYPGAPSEGPGWRSPMLAEGQAGSQTTSNFGNVPKGDFEKFVSSRRGQAAEIPGAGPLGSGGTDYFAMRAAEPVQPGQAPAYSMDPRAIVERNRFLANFERGEMEDQLARAQLEQQQQEAQIDPRDMAAAKVGLMKGQTEEAIGQGAAGRGAGALAQARAAVEMPTPQQGAAKGEATGAEVAALETTLQRAGEQFLMTPQGQIQLKVAMQQIAQAAPQASPEILQRIAASKVVDQYKQAIMQQYLSKTIAGRDPYALGMRGVGGGY